MLDFLMRPLPLGGVAGGLWFLVLFCLVLLVYLLVAEARPWG